MSTAGTAMAEGSELMKRLMSENADLKKQVRLLKENQMLKRLLSESCQEPCGRGSRELLFPKAPAYPEACSPGSTGEPLWRVRRPPSPQGPPTQDPGAPSAWCVSSGRATESVPGKRASG